MSDKIDLVIINNTNIFRKMHNNFRTYFNYAQSIFNNKEIHLLNNYDEQ